MDTKTKIHTIISIVLVTLIAILAYIVQLPSKDIKAELLDTDTVLVRIQDFAFDPDIIRINPETTVTWLHDESEGNSDVQHTVTSYDPEDVSKSGEEFESDLLSLGDTFSHTFNEEGVYYYNCSLHPFMTGKVCVGDLSEELDDDCAIEVTEPEGAGGLDEEIGEEAATSEESASEEEASEEEKGAEEKTTASEATKEDTSDQETDNFLGKDLFPSADESFNASANMPTPPPASSFQQQIPEQNKTELADSGPEVIIYFIVVLAIMGLKRFKKFAL
jgi:plastocyanin